ncbi:MAG TPA: DUF4369 domain-containing protein, partial [Bacteroidales bacterium]
MGIRSLISTFFFLLILTFSSTAQYSINIHIDGYQDTALLMTSYYGNKIRLIDTAYVSSPGNFRFEGKNDLPGGIYMAVSTKKAKLFEFVVDKKQKFSLTTDTVSYSLNMKVKGSEENEIFYDYLKYNERLFRENEVLNAKLKDLIPESDEYKKIKFTLDSVNNLAGEYKLKVIKEKP